MNESQSPDESTGEVAEGIPSPSKAVVAGQDMNEDRPPPSGEVVRTQPEPPTHEDTTRTWLAYWLVGLLAALALIGAMSWCINPDLDHVQAYGVLFSPVVTLVGTVLGFYFGRPKN